MVGRAQLVFLRDIYLYRVVLAYHGYLHRDPLGLLNLRAGIEDPYPLYRRIRALGPVAPTPLGNHQSAHHRICREVLKDRRFGVEVEDRPGNNGEHKLSFLEMDPPDHTRLRRLAAPSFSPRLVSGFADQIQRTTDQLLDPVRPGEPFDLVPTLAAPLPIAVITDLLGIPDANAAEFTRYGSVIGSALSGVRSVPHAFRLVAAEKELARIFGEVFEAKRRQPADDMISRLVAAEGETIKPHELVPMVTLLLIAGFETTVNLIGNAVLALLDHPDQWRLLTEDPSLAGRAVEETLRYDSPVQRTVRAAKTDVELAGTTIPAGQLMVVMIGGANRDPEVFSDPDRFNLMRGDASEHLAFSSGIHYCLGAPLAQLEATVALRTLAERFPDLAKAGRLKRRPGGVIRGLQQFPVSATRVLAGVPG